MTVVGLGLLINEVSRSHSVGFLRTSDRLVTKTSTWQHTTLTRDRHLCPDAIRIRNPSNHAIDRAATEIGFRFYIQP